MGVGTSLGAYFEDSFNHQAGTPEEIKPPATNDNNVVTPSEQRTNQDLDKAELDPTTGLGIEVGYKPKTKIDAIDKITGLNTERYQMWPERLVRSAIDTMRRGMNGEIPGYVVDPDTGEFHTSPEMMDAAHSIMPFIMNGMMPATIHLGGEGLKALEATATEGPDPFRQFLAGRGARQQSNIAETPTGPVSEWHPETPMERPAGSTDQPHSFYRQVQQEHEAAGNGPLSSQYRQEPFTDHMNDEEFYRYGLNHPDGGMTEAQENRWAEVDRRLAEQDRQRLENHNFDVSWEDDFGVRHSGDYSGDALDNSHTIEDYDPLRSRTRFMTEEEQTKLQRAMMSDNATLIKDSNSSSGRRDSFIFASSQGAGELNLTYTPDTKQIYVHWMGEMNHEPMTFGTKEVRSILRQLKEQYPEAETIKGFRVSGARYNSGRGAANAVMRLRPARSEAP